MARQCSHTPRRLAAVDVEPGHPLRGPLDSAHHREIVLRFLAAHPERWPRNGQQYACWNDVPNQPHLDATTLIFVDGGIRSTPLDLGHASLVNDGGIIEAPISCGLIHRDGGIRRAMVRERDDPCPRLGR
jgi:hypothetical protein